MRSSGNGHYENLRLINPVIPVILLSMNDKAHLRVLTWYLQQI